MNRIRYSRLSGYLIVLVWLAALAAFSFNVTFKLERFSDKQYKLLTPPPLVQLKPAFVDLLMLGHTGIYHDFINIWGLQFLVDPAIKKESPEDVNAVIRLILGQQPQLESFYMIACFVMAFDLEKPQYCEPISVVGLKAFPQSWRIPMTQAFVSGFMMNDSTKASAFYHIAASRDQSPPYVAHVAQKLLDQAQLSDQEILGVERLLNEIPGGAKFSALFKQKTRRKTAEELPIQNVLPLPEPKLIEPQETHHE